ncbi:hypothetical protein MATL_G00141760 [Megalops atlanticus]|uniref:Uncharacterized protein n=1 Tax=Megalops atlanticus TaxID=7932 RepID=A0A9D3PTP2_MEGAT|nr:hypothetical protein MATL_G00141760 [Megalops atlanticus]
MEVQVESSTALFRQKMASFIGVLISPPVICVTPEVSGSDARLAGAVSRPHSGLSVPLLESWMKPLSPGPHIQVPRAPRLEQAGTREKKKVPAMKGDDKSSCLLEGAITQADEVSRTAVCQPGYSEETKQPE